MSIDTTKAAVAAAALEAGATIVNDVSAGRPIPDLLGVVADAGAGYVAMHMLGEPRTMQDDPRYDDVVAEVGDFLVERLDAAAAAGIARESLMADPGHRVRQDRRAQPRAARPSSRSWPSGSGVPLLVGASRKSFIGRLLGVDDPAARDDGTLATVVWALDHGARMVRVHDVAQRGPRRRAARRPRRSRGMRRYA